MIHGPTSLSGRLKSISHQCLCENKRGDILLSLKMAPCTDPHYFPFCSIYISIHEAFDSWKYERLLTLERPSKICCVIDQPGLVGPLSTFYAMDLLCDECSLYVWSYKCLILRIYVLKQFGQ